MTGTANQMIAQARRSLGTEEHPPGSNFNYIVKWFNDHVDRIGNGPWCDMSITMWASLSGNGTVVGEFAYTVYHAEWFQKRGQFFFGARGIRAGDVVFFDWGGSRRISNIDHVGLVERVEGDEIHTIEGNSGDVCKRVVRDDTFIVGYGRPAYATPAVVAPSGAQVLKSGSTGDRVRALQRALNKALSAGLDVDGEFGSKTTAAVKKLQTKAKIKVDGEYGTNSAKALKVML
jgi:hypothetical protein